MKLNFWQWLGLALLIVGLVLIVLRETKEEEAPIVPPAPPVMPAP